VKNNPQISIIDSSMIEIGNSSENYSTTSDNSFKYSWERLKSMIRFDLKTIKGQPLPEGVFGRIEDIRPVNSIDFYNDFYKNVSHVKRVRDWHEAYLSANLIFGLIFGLIQVKLLGVRNALNI
jgi:hypothetical protein